MEYGGYVEHVRPPYKSKAEIQIARLLDRERIAFRYEHPLAVIDRDKTKIWYPDFSLSDYGMIIEYFGMNDDSGYRKRAERKMQVYRENRSAVTGRRGSLVRLRASFKDGWIGSMTPADELLLAADQPANGPHCGAHRWRRMRVCPYRHGHPRRA
jgi:hypothetical protein